MKRITIIILLIGLSFSTATAQVKDRFEKKKSDTTQVEPKSPEEIVEQDEPEEENIWDRLVYGGNASLSFGSYTFVLLAPSVGYRINDKLVGGTGFIYQYMRWNQGYTSGGNLVNLPNNDQYKNELYGPKFFVNYFPYKQIFLGTQFEYLNHDLVSFNPVNYQQTRENRWTPVLFLEAGLRQSIGKKGFALIGLRANVLHDYTSPYASWWYPVIGIYF